MTTGNSLPSYPRNYSLGLLCFRSNLVTEFQPRILLTGRARYERKSHSKLLAIQMNSFSFMWKQANGIALATVPSERTVVPGQCLVPSFGERHSGIALNDINADVVRS